MMNRDYAKKPTYTTPRRTNSTYSLWVLGNVVFFSLVSFAVIVGAILKWGPPHFLAHLVKPKQTLLTPYSVTRSPSSSLPVKQQPTFAFYSVLAKDINLPSTDVLPPPSATVPPDVLPPTPPHSTQAYQLEVNTFTNLKQANELRAKLLLRGYEAKLISDSPLSGAPQYTISIGPFKNKSDALHQQQRLTEQGFTTTLK